MNLTPELLADLRKKAEAATTETTTIPAEKWLTFVQAATPRAVLALLDKIAALEEEIDIRNDAAVERGERD